MYLAMQKMYEKELKSRNKLFAKDFDCESCVGDVMAKMHPEHL
jgi:ribosomal protein S17